MVLEHRPAQQGLRLIVFKIFIRYFTRTRASSSTTRIETSSTLSLQMVKAVLEHRPAQQGLRHIRENITYMFFQVVLEHRPAQQGLRLIDNIKLFMR